MQEFRVSPNSVSAESGRAGGAVVNIVTKSGSNKFHGTAVYYLRDSTFNARSVYLDIKPYDRQQLFGFTFGGPLRRNRAFFFSGYDQHIFHEPTVVHFVDGSSVVVPLPGAGPATPGDYEASDQQLVFDAASRLSQQSGLYPSKLLGNAVFAKLDLSVTPHNQLSARISTSGYSGENNVFLDPSSPMTTYGISDNGIEHVETETASVSLTCALSLRMVSHLRAVFARCAVVTN